jgi:aminotransferase
MKDAMKDRLSRRVRELRYSVIREMMQRANETPDVISLSIGEPDFVTPEAVTRAAMADALAGHTHYTASQGDPELRAAISADIKAHQGLDIPAGRILVTHGGMGGLTAALRTLLEEGDEVLLPEPHFPDYLAHIAFAGGRPVHVPTRFTDSFVPRPEAIAAAVGPKAKVLILNSPCNPTGAVIPGPTLDEIAKVAVAADLFVISDEVYDRLVYGAPFESIATRPGMAERTVVIKSFSKWCAMTGWRVGYAFGPGYFMEQMLKVVNYSTSCASSVGQRAALAALRCDPAPFAAMGKAFEERVDYLYERLAAMPGVRVSRPRGAFYIFPDFSAFGRDCRALAFELVDTARVATVPGYAFGPSGQGCLRLAATVDKARLATAMDRLQAFLAAKRA